jgi:hypothetical protein
MKLNNRLYPPKVLVAWSESVKGNKEITAWLLQNDYKEFGVFYYALRNDAKSKEWLLDNGFPHLLALITGAEGDGKAINWLRQFGFEGLANVALAGDGNVEAFKWLQLNKELELMRLAKCIKEVKDDIENDNNDVHRISSS